MSAQRALSLAILISGRGSNMAAIAKACLNGSIPAHVACVISDRDSAAGIALARSLGLRTAVIHAKSYEERAQFEQALMAAIDASGAQLVVLAGFMRILSEPFVAHYAGRLLNIHPSLLPSYKGIHTHRRVLKAGEREHGASVHFVSAELDGGPLIMQARVPVHGDDSEQSLSARVQEQEHRIYPRVVGLIASGRLRLDGARVLLDDKPLDAPLTEEAHHADAALGL